MGKSSRLSPRWRFSAASPPVWRPRSAHRRPASRTPIRTGSSRSASRFWARLRNGILAAEIALTLVLLIGAGLLLKSVYLLSVANPGFDPVRILTVRISPNQPACARREACVALYGHLLQRARAVPGVTDAAVANSVPLDGSVPTIPVDIEGHPITAEHPAPMLWLGAVSPGYLRMLRVPLLAGRYLTDADGPGAEAVAVVPASTARSFWPAESAIGKHIRPTGSRTWRTVVGVVGDVQHFRLSRALPDGVAGAIYLPYAQSELGDGQIPAAMTLLAATGPAAARAAQAIEQLAKDLDPDTPAGRAQALPDVVTGSIAEIHSTMLLFSCFASVAVVLAAAGIYGLMSYWVSQRTYEIGLRLAVGCTRRGILSMILAQGIRLTLYGIVGGILGAVLLTRFLATQLYGVAATDLPTFVAVTALVLAVALLATAFPAWRATRIDPILALRAE